VNLNKICYTDLAEGHAMLRDIMSFSTKVEELAQFDSMSIEHDVLGRPECSSAETEGVLAIIDSNKFLQQCIQRSVQSALTIRVENYSSVLEFGNKPPSSSSIRLIIISLLDVSIHAATDTLEALSDLAPSVPIIVLSSNSSLELARAVMERGAKGFIPVTMGFEIAIEAVRFVLAGGAYVPADFLLTPASPGGAPQQHRPAIEAVTSRELTVVRAIQQGKPNKLIAFELHMAESTVKVHVRNIMKKLAAKNRTDVAIKCTRLLSA
jgi:DNA-binding NarL/FixJ family response regulator